MKKLFFLCLAMLSIVGLSAFKAKEDPILVLLKKLEAFTKKYPTEKAYLHLDKPYYAAGDDIWFKAYVTDGSTGQLSDMSSILYVELINQTDKVEKKLRLRMQNGLTWGDFKLPDTLRAGNYRIRAYTQWMRNAGPDFFFDKTIKIGNTWTNKVLTKTQFSALGKDSTRAVIAFTDEKGVALTNKNVEFNAGLKKGRDKTNDEGQIGINFPNTKGNIDVRLTTAASQTVEKIIPIKLQAAQIDIQFLPEGGNLIIGTKSKIAVKAIGTNGLGMKVKGSIIDQTGLELDDFETSELGMGSFYLIPEPKKIYTAKIASISKLVTLPKADSSGYALAFTALDSTKFMATVIISRDLLNKGELNLVAQKNGIGYSSSKLSPTTRTIEIIYGYEDFPQGIIQFTLFSPTNIPVCERLFFVNNKANDISVDLTSLKLNYEKKEKVDLNLFSTLNAQPVIASFSIAVTNEDAVKPDFDNESHIKANLLLTSDLKGYVEKPNTYFLNKDAKANGALDLLMLTQGWRKVDWRMQEPAIKHEVEKGLTISGIISKNEVPIAMSRVSLMTNAGGMFVIDTISNEKGEFIFEDLEFEDPTKFIIQARTEKEKRDVKIGINLNPEQEVTGNANNNDEGVNINENIENYLQKSTPYFEELSRQSRLAKTIALKEVKITGERPNLAPNSQNLNGPGVADQIIDVSQLEMANSLSKYLQGRISGVVVDPFFGWAISRRTFQTSKIPSESNKMRVILDGNDVGNNLDQVDTRLIESIEVITSTAKSAIYGPKGQGGLLIITTKKGAPVYDAVRYAPGVTTYLPKGYYTARTFYSPKYDVQPSDKHDLRTTVYWFPNLVTDENGKIKFDYFNTDQAGNYRMVIEGIDLNGNIARTTYTYKVN